jgi:inner membrane protein
VDSITHIVSGALIGEAIAGRQLKKKAMLWGAIAQTIPDVDVITSLWMSPAQSVLAHRGFTHSFLFVALASPFLAGLVKGLSRNQSMTLLRWMILFATELTVHLTIDSLTTYGTAWFEPFSHHRVSFNVIFVADPFYTFWMLLAVLVLLIMKSEKKVRIRWITFGLVTSTLYLGYCFNNKRMIDRVVRHELNKEQISYSRFITTPAPLNSWLWYLIAETSDGFYMGYHSVFDKGDPPPYHYFARNDSLVPVAARTEDFHCLKRFSQGYYTIENRNDTLVFNDLRFGQMAGWQDPNSPFVFHYYLQEEGSNKMVVQRGRFAGAGQGAFRSLVERIKGH